MQEYGFSLILYGLAHSAPQRCSIVLVQPDLIRPVLARIHHMGLDYRVGDYAK